MSRPFSELEKARVANIVEIASRYVDRNQREAVANGRIAESIFTANRWANTLSEFKSQGIEPFEHVFRKPPAVIYL